MKRVGIAEAKAQLSEVVREVASAPVIIHNRGRDVAVVLSIAAYEELAKAAEKTPMAEFLDRVQELKERWGGGVEVPYERLDFVPQNPFAPKKRKKGR